MGMECDKSRLVLERTHWYDRNENLRLGPNTEVQFWKETESTSIWGIDRVLVPTVDDRGKPSKASSYIIPESLFSLEPVDSSENELTAVLSLNVDEYNKQKPKIKRILSRASIERVPLHIKVRVDADRIITLRVRLPG